MLHIVYIRLRLHCTRSLFDPIQECYGPAVRFVPARKEEQFCTCTASKLCRHSVNAREKEHFRSGSKVTRYSVNAALLNCICQTCISFEVLCCFWIDNSKTLFETDWLSLASL